MATAKEIVEVPSYVSDDEVDISESQHDGNKEKRKRRRRNWIKDMVFSNGDEAEEAVVKANE